MPLVERLVYRAVSRVMASRPSQWHVLPHGPIEPLRVICVAHGSPVRVQCAEALRSAARRLERSRR